LSAGSEGIEFSANFTDSWDNTNRFFLRQFS